MLAVSPDDVRKWWGVAQTIDNPTGLAGRLVGLDESEQNAGVPVWAWVAIGVSVGVVLGASAFAGPLQRLLRNR